MEWFIRHDGRAVPTDGPGTQFARARQLLAESLVLKAAAIEAAGRARATVCQVKRLWDQARAIRQWRLRVSSPRQPLFDPQGDDRIDARRAPGGDERRHDARAREQS